MQNSTSLTPSTNVSLTFDHVGIYYPSGSNFSFRNKHIRGFWAIEDVSFTIDKGDVLGIVGSNGAGKSTTLATISGIISPDRGSVNTYGHSVTLLSLNAGLISYLSGRKNIFLIGITLGMTRKAVEDVVDKIIEFSELGSFIDKPVNTYSSGMRARLGFSTSIFLHPDIMLIDEVLGVGDKSFKTKSSKMIREKLAGDLTAIIVSHSENQIKELCNKVLWIDKGKTKAFGSTNDVLKQYLDSQS